MIRLLHTSPRLWATFDKSSLAKLRKKTGYTFSNCKKALEVCGNDIEKAEKWLQEQAQALGWAKATKLEGRPTAQGLIGIAVEPGRSATIVEVNCETDFVARNKTFRSLVEQVTASCLQYSSVLPDVSSGPITKASLSSEQLRALPCKKDGAPLSDHMALAVGNVGENLMLRRASCFRAGSGLHLAGYTHPAPDSDKPGSILLGKYGAILALTGPSNAQQLGRQMCQHIVGMCPQKVGDFTADEPSADKDAEPCLVHQEFLLDPSQVVGQILLDAEAKIVDFTRMECGENI